MLCKIKNIHTISTRILLEHSTKIITYFKNTPKTYIFNSECIFSRKKIPSFLFGILPNGSNTYMMSKHYIWSQAAVGGLSESIRWTNSFLNITVVSSIWVKNSAISNRTLRTSTWLGLYGKSVVKKVSKLKCNRCGCHFYNQILKYVVFYVKIIVKIYLIFMRDIYLPV